MPACPVTVRFTPLESKRYALYYKNTGAACTLLLGLIDDDGVINVQPAETLKASGSYGPTANWCASP